MLPLHTWLPDAASEATPGTSVLLVSVLDKIGTFGMIRFCLGLFPEAEQAGRRPVVMALAVVSIVYGALVAIGQQDILPADRLHLGVALRVHRAGHLRC